MITLGHKQSLIHVESLVEQELLKNMLDVRDSWMTLKKINQKRSENLIWNMIMLTSEMGESEQASSGDMFATYSMWCKFCGLKSSKLHKNC